MRDWWMLLCGFLIGATMMGWLDDFILKQAHTSWHDLSTHIGTSDGR